jgi:hypothetical protein
MSGMFLACLRGRYLNVRGSKGLKIGFDRCATAERNIGHPGHPGRATINLARNSALSRATIARPNSVLQSFTRKPMHGAVSVWMLRANLRKLSRAAE